MSAEPDPADFERAHRRSQRRLAIVIAVLVLIPLGWFIATEVQAASEKRAAQLSPDQKAELTALLDRREALARERVAQWNAATGREPLAAFTLGTDECPLKLEPPSKLSAAAYSKFGTHDAAFGTWTLCILRADQPSCARTYEVPPELTAMRSRLGGEDVYAWDLQREKDRIPAEAPPGVVVVVGSEVRPQASSPALGKVTFVPGTLSGRMFLYAPDRGRILCAADISVRNSKTVDIEYSHFGEGAAGQQKTAEYETIVALERDLELHLRFAAPKVLRQVQPP